MSDEKDRDLLQAWSDGDTRAGDRLIRRHDPAVRRYFSTKVPAGEVQDLIQETFMQCTRSLRNFREESNFRGFLLGIARNMLRHYFRTRRRRFSQVDPLTHSVVELSGPGVVTALALKDRRERILWGMRQLPINIQDALEFKFWEGITDREAAGILEIKAGTYKSRVRRGRELLSDILAELED